MKHQEETYIACLPESTGICSQRRWFFVPNLLLGIGLGPQRRICGGHSSPLRTLSGASPSLPCPEPRCSLWLFLPSLGALENLDCLVRSEDDMKSGALTLFSGSLVLGRSASETITGAVRCIKLLEDATVQAKELSIYF